MAHPVAELFPWLGEDELDDLADDIATNGLRQKIIKLADGRLADGRNRELACQIAGVEPQYLTLPAGTPDERIVKSIISANLKRRHLTASQKAMVAASIANMRQGERTDLEPSATLPKVSRAEAAELVGVSERTVTSAAKVQNESPELIEPVLQGKIDVHTAAQAADLPPEEREEIAKAEDPKEEAGLRLAARHRPTGPAIDPDHPHAALLQAITNLAAKVSAAVNAADPDDKLRTYLLHCGFVYPRAKIVNGRSYGWQCVGLRGVYRVVKLAGLPGKTRSKEQIQKQYDAAMNPEGEE